MNPLLESVAMILGASSWPNHKATFKGHRGFRNSATDFRDYLLRNGMPKNNLLWLFDAKVQPGELTLRMVDFLGRVAPPGSSTVRNVVFYYVGHGAYLGDSYVVAPRCCHSKALSGTTLPVRDIARVLAGEAPDKRQIVILDACYAAGASTVFIEQGPDEPAEVVAAQLREHLGENDMEHGTALFCAAGARIRARLPRKDSYTMFSGALLRSLAKGHAAAGPLLPLDTLAWLVRADIRDTFGAEGVRPELHMPKQDKGDISRLPFFPNPANATATELAEPEPAPGLAPHGPAHETAWARESGRQGWYELLEVHKNLDVSGDVVQSHLLTGIHGPEGGAISAIPYSFRAQPEFGTCILLQVTDLQRNWSLREWELPGPAPRLVGDWPLTPPARADAVHRGLFVKSRLFNSFAMTPLDAKLREHPPVEQTSVGGRFPVRNLRLVLLFPPHYWPEEIIVVARRTDDLDKPIAQWPEAPEETARVVPGFFFERERGVAILLVDRALPEFHYVLSWRLPAASAASARALTQARRQVRFLLGLDAERRAGLGAQLAAARDALIERHFLLDRHAATAVDLSIVAYDEVAKVVRIVANTLHDPPGEVMLAWGTGVVGWVMRRRHPAFVDTQDRHTAGIYRVTEGGLLDRHLLCVPLPLPTDTEDPTAALADRSLPCLVATLSCRDEQGNLGLLKDSAELLGIVSSELAGQVLDIVAHEAPS